MHACTRGLQCSLCVCVYSQLLPIFYYIIPSSTCQFVIHQILRASLQSKSTFHVYCSLRSANSFIYFKGLSRDTKTCPNFSRTSSTQGVTHAHAPTRSTKGLWTIHNTCVGPNLYSHTPLSSILEVPWTVDNPGNTLGPGLCYTYAHTPLCPSIPGLWTIPGMS